MEKIETTLKLLVNKIPMINFALIGSSCLNLHGIKIYPNDIDFLTDDEGIKRISQIFNSKILKNEIGYLETIFKINNVEIHFTSNVSNPIRLINFMDYTVLIEKNGIKIPCMSLESEFEVYRKMKREKDKNKTKLIKEYLKIKNR